MSTDLLDRKQILGALPARTTASYLIDAVFWTSVPGWVKPKRDIEPCMIPTHSKIDTPNAMQRLLKR